ncbi:MAG: ATP-binding region ATPase domain protein [Akkermansiaceae bacterium]|nr:ATP-binding region ATPase domain protein [Akkermansiaceae bacterium]
MPDHLDALAEETRMRVLEGILAPQGEHDREFDRLTRLGAQLLGTPICLVSLVTEDRQVFKGACGLPDDLAEARQTPISHSLCKFAVLSRSPFIVRNGPADERVRDHPAITDLGLKSYLGFPLMTDEGHVLGSFCVIDFLPREWRDEELDLVRNLAALAVGQLEAATARERARSAFDLVLHDLKSPMSSVVMASCLLNEAIAEVPERLHPLLNIISESTTRAVNLMSSLAHADQASSCPRFGDPAEVLGTVVGSLATRAEAKGIHLHLEVDEAQPLLVPDWVLTQVVENLLINAIKFSPRQRQVWITFRPEAQAGIIEIRDQGPGFTQEDRKRLFKRYTRLSASPTGDEASTGLGLSIVKRLVDQHGGTIELLSGESEGAVFRISFPMG